MISSAQGTGECYSLWMQKTTNSLLHNMALRGTAGGFKDFVFLFLSLTVYLYVQISRWNLLGRECNHHFVHVSTILAVQRSDCGWQKSLCGQRWEAMEGNWLLLTRGCQNGDGAAVHFQFQPTDWNPPLGSPVSQAPFSEPMVWKTWFNSCSMLFITFSISPNRLCVASHWRSNCASLWMVECNILW